MLSDGAASKSRCVEMLNASRSAFGESGEVSAGLHVTFKALLSTYWSSVLKITTNISNVDVLKIKDSDYDKII